ncbi:MAG: hypothetical protein IT222_02595 [Crocinitomix sp.]|nr:hypothetical protein [Crocinitomix sp.]
MKNLLFLFTTLLIVWTSQAQNDSVNYKHSLGLSAGISTGAGFSYRYWPKKIGFQVTGIPVFSSYHFFSSSGVSLLAKIRDFNQIRLFGYLGTNMDYRRYNFGVYGEQPDYRTYTFNSALGVGFRFNFLKYFDLNLQTGYGVRYNTFVKLYHTYLSGEVSVYYHF